VKTTALNRAQRLPRQLNYSSDTENPRVITGGLKTRVLGRTMLWGRGRALSQNRVSRNKANAQPGGRDVRRLAESAPLRGSGPKRAVSADAEYGSYRPGEQTPGRAPEATARLRRS
jgi:hypothetical protein